MTTSDKSKHKFCIASIKRCTFKPYEFQWTKFYESNLDFSHSETRLDLTQNELIICSTIIDSDNYSILTTQQLITSQTGQICSGNIDGAANKMAENLDADFKGTKKNNMIIMGHLQLQNGSDLSYFVETGNASMVMIHGIKALIETREMTDLQVENLIRIWKKRDEKMKYR